MSTKKQLSRFIFVGTFAVLIDFCSYKILMDYLSYSPAKTLSFLLGALFAFLANKFFTFQRNKYSPIEIFRFAILYLSTLLGNVLVNKISILTLNYFSQYYALPEKAIFTLAFLAATGFSTICNFIGQKFWVFHSKN